MSEKISLDSSDSSTLKHFKNPITNTIAITIKNAQTYIIAIRLRVFSFGSELPFELISGLSVSAI